MRLCFDMDGVLTEGKYTPKNSAPIEFLSLTPYDRDTVSTWNQLCTEHTTIVITGRALPNADMHCKDWFEARGMMQPDILITNPVADRPATELAKWKFDLANLLACDLIFEDNPRVSEHWRMECWNAETLVRPQVYLVDNPEWPLNQDSSEDRIRSWKEIYETVEYHAMHRTR